ncbi:MAG: hypothetical protein ILA22_06875 [Prevotella sp.]|nr:hypothetical protein [Prevotella sp.]
MKKFKIWSMMMLVAMALPMMVACGGDDDNDGGGVSYTESEIVEMLTGKWQINGFVRMSAETGEKYEGNYTGTVEFTAAQKYIFKSSDIFEVSVSFNNQISTVKISLPDLIWGNNYQKYSILRKNGKIYLTFGTSSRYQSFQIVSLTPSSFRLVEDEDISFESSSSSGTSSTSKAHYYITIISE